ncbi:3-dehydroquinate synthase [Dethiosulfatibacter aminovorans DSM 17477]|uniref:3-dehydroquinate synthase n=1 Tax=Dethiosulfatibacter aminovorans DSM 17477 TaxID=1121476 RepID=A0A1M6H2I2_9FIRM|nr:3-dehydroquinate synthase [Dethiosulfatibacter aminovorans]SHJ16344.1 3-dehydroquinate synthase [Dethiosulfatibacter aminovorans DSM 17477]
MKSLRVNLPDRTYDIEIGSNILGNIPAFINDKGYSNRFYVIDNNVYDLHREKLEEIIAGDGFLVIGTGEENKTFSNLEKILSSMVEAGLDRKSVLVAVGGGVTGDICGLAAALFMRGISAVQVPTTLLSQVDSSVGGKTAINLSGIKNIVGAFYQPDKVFIDIDFLKTLEKKEIMSGIGEIAKYGFIVDEDYIDYLQNNLERIEKLEDEYLLEIIFKSVDFKAQIVEKDEKESSIRKILNFGHTVGHGIELMKNVDITHGEAVAAGMILEGIIAFNRGNISKEYLQEIISLCRRIYLIPDFTEYEIDIIIENTKHDKKNVGDSINMVLPVSRGAVESFDGVTIDEIKECFRSWSNDYK